MSFSFSSGRNHFISETDKQTQQLIIRLTSLHVLQAKIYYLLSLKKKRLKQTRINLNFKFLDTIPTVI